MNESIQINYEIFCQLRANKNAQKNRKILCCEKPNYFQAQDMIRPVSSEEANDSDKNFIISKVKERTLLRVFIFH